MPWWMMPAITLSIALWVKAKRKAGKFRWIQKTEEEMKKLPAGYIMARLMEHGDELPEAPEGFRWKELRILVSTTPITAPEEVVLHVLEPMFSNEGVQAFLTTQQINNPKGLGSTYLTTQGEERSPKLGLFPVEQYFHTSAQLDGNIGYFLTEEYLEAAPHLGPGPRIGDDIEDIQETLRVHGKRLAQLAPDELRAGDFVVFADDCSVHEILAVGAVSGLLTRQIDPPGPGGMQQDRPIACAFGPRPLGPLTQ